MSGGTLAAPGRPLVSIGIARFSEFTHVMFAYLIAVVAAVVLAALRQESGAVLDRVDPRLWLYLHH